MAKYRNNRIKAVTDISKALGDINRVRIVMSLWGEELCVCQIVELLALAPSTVSKHLYILKQAGLIDSAKKGRWVHYRLSQKDTDRTVQKVLKWLQQSLQQDSVIKEDKKSLKKILKEHPEQLCRRIKGR